MVARTIPLRQRGKAKKTSATDAVACSGLADNPFGMFAGFMSFTQYMSQSRQDSSSSSTMNLQLSRKQTSTPKALVNLLEGNSASAKSLTLAAQPAAAETSFAPPAAAEKSEGTGLPSSQCEHAAPTSAVKAVSSETIEVSEKEAEATAVPPVSLADTLQRLQRASGAKKRPAGQIQEQKSTTVEPKPKVKSFAANMKKKQALALKRPASSSKSHSTGEMIYPPQGQGKKIPSKAKCIAMCPNGCSRCRNTPGHAPSCWVKKGWTL